jgi:hypothetical protein
MAVFAAILVVWLGQETGHANSNESSGNGPQKLPGNVRSIHEAVAD